MTLGEQTVELTAAVVVGERTSVPCHAHCSVARFLSDIWGCGHCTCSGHHDTVDNQLNAAGFLKMPTCTQPNEFNTLVSVQYQLCSLPADVAGILYLLTRAAQIND